VTIFTTSECPHCKEALRFLRSNGIKLTNYDVDEDPEAKKRLVRLRGEARIPYALINGRWVPGFSEKQYRDLLKVRY